MRRMVYRVRPMGLWERTPAAETKTEAAKPPAAAPADAVLPAAASPAAAPAVAAPADAAAGKKKLKVYIIFYSTYGHIEKLAREYKTALESVGDVEAHLFGVAETLPAEALEKMHAPPKPDDIPVMETGKLPDADAFVFGFPTRCVAMSERVGGCLPQLTGQGSVARPQLNVCWRS
ncbi:hypothetical protein HYH02_005617 [Chlamydomonas schloesseri]|uniref:Flavodoxin-like domain-containing protein n=1 Tax=Chlamydomonas schloesseri TaxID=2026947 RepID=A0A835WKW8_9CHLO|nr:hypothetical protein HYH02_005617 [Chlamydomonas schloesseri]|eukprot:KAG2449472.1 hypothetical protein HYH02_005617 [Chlamydomonas schloesseri]